MQRVVQFTGPRQVTVTELAPEPLCPGQVRVRTRYSGISAGTELTAYRGTNPYLVRTWDPQRRLFSESTEQPSQPYPIVGWGYSESGEVAEVAPDVTDLRPGDSVWGIWGHRSEAVLAAEKLRLVPDGLDPLAASFARVGAVALNAILAADLHLGERAVLFGQGVIGLLATQMARRSGVEVIAVDTIADRRARAREAGALEALDHATDQVAERVRELGGADVAIELSGAYPALHEATRAVDVGGRVVAAGFYQDEGRGLRLGEEFHHNRVEIVSSQIGGVPPRLAGRWNQDRLNATFLALCAAGELDPVALVTHRVPPEQAAQAYQLLDRDPASALQVVIDFGETA